VSTRTFNFSSSSVDQIFLPRVGARKVGDATLDAASCSDFIEGVPDGIKDDQGMATVQKALLVQVRQVARVSAPLRWGMKKGMPEVELSMPEMCCIH
jgi:hypothetical protein